nr:uncharacterized protein LOC109403469 isoform X1 [Aedes albopictus]
MCDSVINNVLEYVESSVLVFLRSQNIMFTSEQIASLRNLFRLEKLFDEVSTFQKQSRFLEKLSVSAPTSKDILLSRREDVRHINSIPKKILVNETASYISIIDTLKLIFRNPQNRRLLEKENDQSENTPCVTEYSTFKSGETFKTKDLFRSFPNCVRISIYQDEVELGNALSSRAGINKVSNFSFKIQNFPDKWNSSTRTVFPLLYCTTIDVKKNGYGRILKPLITDLKALEDGVEVYYGSEKFVLKAVMTIFCGDTLAVHDVFGYLSPSANYFCRICQISRNQFHSDPSEEHAIRDKNWYTTNLELVQQGSIAPKECGLKVTGTPFNSLQHFHVTENFALDGMHDLAEGIVPLTIQLVLSYYYKQKERKITAKILNNKISTFCYGFNDRCNKPSPNFTEEMLSQPKNHKLRQTSAQNLLLLRVLPFLIREYVPEECEYMKLIGHLINIVRIIMSPVVSENLLFQLEEHVEFFEQIFCSKFDRRINKLHHLRHYVLCIRKSGSMKQFNCLQFEQTNKIGKNQAATCKNFKNICSSLGKRQCFRMIINILDNPFCDNIKYISAKLANPEECLSNSYLDQSNETVLLPKSILVNGIQLRPNLIIALKIHSNNLFPSYGIIRELVVVDDQIYILIRKCSTTWYDEYFQAYEVTVTAEDELLSIEDCFIHTTYSFWSTPNDPKKYISRRFYNRDY